MTYVSCPNSGQSLGQTRDQMRTNTDLLKQSLAINHVDLGLADVGKHKFVVMPVQAAAPTTAASEASTYSKTVSARSQIFFIRDNVAGTECALTAGDTSNVNFSAVNNGWTFLPGGLLLQYGQVVSPSSGGTVTFPIAFSALPYSITTGFLRSSSGSAHSFWMSSTTPPTATQFVYFTDTTSATLMYWTAIGKA